MRSYIKRIRATAGGRSNTRVSNSLRVLSAYYYKVTEDTLQLKLHDFLHSTSLTTSFNTSVSKTMEGIKYIQQLYRKHAIFRDSRIKVLAEVVLNKAINALTASFIRQKKKYPYLEELATKINTVSPDIMSRII
jgi:hypothetical protein